jgi:hypothetical protein
MDRYIGIDAHSESCTVVVMGPSGKRLRQQVVDTAATVLIAFLKGVSRRTTKNLAGLPGSPPRKKLGLGSPVRRSKSQFGSELTFSRGDPSCGSLRMRFHPIRATGAPAISDSL